MLRQVGLNSLWILLARVAALALSVIFVAIIARKLGVEVFGQYTLLASMVYIGNMFTTFGTDGLLVRELAPQGRLTSMVSTALWTQISLSILWCSVVVILALFLDTSLEFLVALTLYNLSLLPLSFYSVASSVIRAFERMDLYLGLNLCTALLQVLGAVLIAGPSGGLIILSAWLLAVQIIGAIVALLICRSSIPAFSLSMTFIFGDVVGLIQAGWRVALISPMGLLLQRLNIFMLTAIAGDTITGLFSAASRLVEGLKVGHFSVLNALMPQLSRPMTSERHKVSNTSLFFLLLWSMALVASVMVFADPIIAIVFGPTFASSAGVLRIISCALIPYTFCSYFSVSLIMRGQEAVVLKAHLICFAGALLLYFFLIKRYGLQGAAWGTLGSETLLAILLAFGKYRSSFLSSDAVQPS